MRALVTGAGGGIGSAIAAQLLEGGVDTIGHDLVRPTVVDAGLTWATGDLTQPDGFAELGRAVRRSARLDSVFVAHGVEGSGSIKDLTDARVRRVMLVNFLTVVHLWQAVSPRLTDSAGSFVVISSANGLLGEAGNSAYCASKFAVLGWARAQARCAPQIRVRVLCPGCTETPLLRSGLQGMSAATGRTVADLTDEYQASIPVRRFSKPHEIAAAALMLSRLRSPTFLVAAVTGGEVLH